ncbi:hypothetical protein T4D_2600 [Trichinella pseudospiralis]|uniref:Uncharacterized protein n=1 Tax=Trichinella pseudospiralis TaxID=6337 RepID=A0A0V1F226_TRIPS|nr:hypothetical protein T4D_2600 [Trichinella pseudospiralis]
MSPSVREIIAGRLISESCICGFQARLVWKPTLRDYEDESNNLCKFLLIMQIFNDYANFTTAKGIAWGKPSG